MLTREIMLLAAQAGHRDRILPLEEPDHRGHRVFRGNGDAYMHMIRHQVPFDDLAFLLPCQRMEDFSQLPTRLTKEHAQWLTQNRVSSNHHFQGLGEAPTGFDNKSNGIVDDVNPPGRSGGSNRLDFWTQRRPHLHCSIRSTAHVSTTAMRG